ncbi:MAG: 50S ribosomal protein L35 [Fimbriimonadia bacterium]|jgi:large subunit ribosomal protein L35
MEPVAETPAEDELAKLKTSKTAMKRFKVSGSGKLIRRRAYDNHMFIHKRGNRKRRLGSDATLTPAFEKRMKRMLGM